MLFDIGLLGRTIGVAVIVLSAGTAEAQFQLFPPFQQQQKPQQPPPPQQPPQRVQQPPQKAQPPAQKAQQPVQRTQPASQKAQPAPVPTPFGEVRTACSTELKGTCAGVAPGSADSVQCLKRNFAVHSPACQAALTRAGNAVQPAAAPAPRPTEPAGTADTPRRISTDRVAPAATTAPEETLKELKLPSMRPTQEARFVSRYCREDHSLLCQGVTFGQSRVLKCLISHQTSLTNECRTALARR